MFIGKIVFSLFRPPTLDGRGRILLEGATELTINKLSAGTKYTVVVSGENDKTGGMEMEIVQNTSTSLDGSNNVRDVLAFTRKSHHRLPPCFYAT